MAEPEFVYSIEYIEKCITHHEKELARWKNLKDDKLKEDKNEHTNNVN